MRVLRNLNWKEGNPAQDTSVANGPTNAPLGNRCRAGFRRVTLCRLWETLEFLPYSDEWTPRSRRHLNVPRWY